jgi:hypothetical protein
MLALTTGKAGARAELGAGTGFSVVKIQYAVRIRRA